MLLAINVSATLNQANDEVTRADTVKEKRANAIQKIRLLVFKLSLKFGFFFVGKLLGLLADLLNRREMH
jgi:hypothetical protein